MVEEWHKLGAEELPRLQKEKLTAFGFRLCNTDLVYETYLLGGIFWMSVKITDDGSVWTRLIDTESKE